MLSNAGKIRRYYKEYIAKFKWFFALYLILSTILRVLSMTIPFLNSMIIDSIIDLNFYASINVLSIMALVFLGNIAFGLLETYTGIYLSNKISVETKLKVYNRILRLKLHKQKMKTVGEYMSLLDGDTGAVGSFYFSSITALIMNVIVLVISGYFIFSMSLTLSLVGLLSVPINLIIYTVFGRKMKVIQTTMRGLSDKYTGQVQESLLGLKEIKGLSIENNINGRYNGNMQEIFKANMKSGLTSAFGGLAQMLSGNFMQIAQMALAAYLIVQGHLTVGLYVAFGTYLGNFISSLQKLTAMNVSLQTTIVSMDRLDEIMESDTEEDYINMDTKHIKTGNINVDNVYFSYTGTKNILNGMNLAIKANEAVAIAGSSGVGKTTFFNLLMRFYDFENGDIKIDGNSIKEYDVSHLRESITYVQQDAFLFNDTIINNLRMVKPDATLDEIELACKKAFLLDFIHQLPDGFDTIIGENGTQLSGGQRQRLAIARGLLKNSLIFLLDEVTSDLDGEAETYLIKTIELLSKNHTVILIAHRLSTIMHMPRIIVFDNGQAISSGTHFELMNNCNVYKKLFDQKNE